MVTHKSWYVVDVFLMKYLGPYPRKDHAEQTRREMRKIVPSDLFLEISTNILVVDEDKFSEWGCSSLERTNMKELRKKYGPDKTAGIVDRYVKESSLGMTPRKKSKIISTE